MDLRKPLIVGNLFDTATSYSWAQDMKKAFPEGSMMTWQVPRQPLRPEMQSFERQGMGHTFPKYASDYNEKAVKECWGHVADYLQDGTLPGNGFVCWQKKDPPVR